MDILLNQKAERIRNVCILAHVDHGKTTLADALLATNGFISAKSAGKLRFLDDRADEQERGITMKSSAIALAYRKAAKTDGSEETTDAGDYVVNLVDSPGHIDFSREVLTAARLCDGALVLVDVVEGVCAQTTAALRCVWDEQLSAILVLNKIDRLFTELRMNATQAYNRLRQVLEQVNAVCADLFLRNSVFANGNGTNGTSHDSGNRRTSTSNRDTLDDTNCYFEAHRNVIFASAIDSWAFTAQDFARLYAKRLGISEHELLERFWMDAFYSSAERRIVDGATERGRKPLFVQFALDNVASVYEAVTNRERARVERIIASLNLTVKQQLLKCLNDDGAKLTEGDSLGNEARVLLRTIMGSWLPLANCAFSAIVQCLPPANRLPRTRFVDWFSADTECQRISEALLTCDASNQLQLAFVTKLICVPHLRTDEDNSDADLVAVTRVYSGTLREGQPVFVLERKHSTQVAHECVLQRIYVLRGRDLKPISQASAGMVVGIAGLAGSITKYATISNYADTPALEFCRSGITRDTERDTMVMRVALEPSRAAEKRTLDTAIERLARVDPEARVKAEANGETVLCAAGEVHLEKCLYDLRNSYCPSVNFTVSPIRVPFRETLVYASQSAPWDSEARESSETVSESEALESLRDRKRLVDTSTASGDCRIRLQACPLPPAVAETLERHAALVRLLQSVAKRPSMAESLKEATKTRLAAFREALRLAFSASNWPPVLADRLIAFGPRETRCNLLVNATACTTSVWHSVGLLQNDASDSLDVGSLTHGFQLACRSGPLCGEPITNVCFLLFEYSRRVNESNDANVEATRDAARLGQLITTTRQACTRAFSIRGGTVSRRLMLAMYVASVYTQFDQLGKVYTVLGRRFARILSESECSSSVLCVDALLPVVESVGFADELRRLTHGFASPTLRVTDWQMLDEDVDTLDELDGRTEELDADQLHAASLTRARRYINDLRRRKGMATDEQLVVHAEKQTTLNRKK